MLLLLDRVADQYIRVEPGFHGVDIVAPDTRLTHHDPKTNILYCRHGTIFRTKCFAAQAKSVRCERKLHHIG